MALVEPGRVLPELPPVDPRLLDRAASAGRVRGAVQDTWAQVLSSPGRADPILRRALREARHLHSRERRFVADALYGLLRYHRWLAALGDPLDVWLEWHRSGPRLPELPADDVEALALLGSIDRDFAAALIADRPDPIAFLAASNRRAPVVVRANRRRCTRERLAERLAAEGVATHPASRATDGLVLEGTTDVHTLPSFRDGWFEVQDEGSQLVGDFSVGPASPPAVIDWCAGAGGKALQLASAGADVLALDVRSWALEELANRARRAGTPIRTAVLPARIAPAPVVLVDAPCTGSGTLRRHPELRFRIDGAAIARVTAEQRQILADAAESVLPGGRLVYATCSVLRAEDEEVVEDFLAERPGWEPQGEALRLSPETDGTDGFYARALVRR